jgi:flagellar basal-body rod protein FlgC
MDIFRALGVSASGLAAQRARMDVIAENLANADSSVSATGRPYQRKLVVLEGLGDAAFPALLQSANDRPGAVRVSSIVESQEPPRRIFQPEHPQASADGYVTLPSVNPLREMVDMLTSTRAYEANATAFQASKSMGQRLLELLR